MSYTVLSTNILVSHISVIEGKTLQNSRNNKGPSVAHCGMPMFTDNESNNWPNTDCDLPVR